MNTTTLRKDGPLLVFLLCIVIIAYLYIRKEVEIVDSGQGLWEFYDSIPVNEDSEYHE